VPVKVSIPKAGALSVSHNNRVHVCAVSASEAFCWGANSHGQLGHAIGEEGDVDCLDVKCNPTPKNIAALPATIRSITAAGGYTCAVDQSGKVHCWGYHGYGVTTATGPAPRVLDLNATAVAGRSSHVCALLQGSTVKCWGESTAGKLGVLDDSTTACIPGVGWRCQKEPQSVSLFGARLLDAGGTNVVVTASGSLVAWGANSNGRLGIAPAAGPKTCLAFDGVTPTPCSDTPVEVVLP
jgi:alpha-tubulin suppressor-like RCC1 family protein